MGGQQVSSAPVTPAYAEPSLVNSSGRFGKPVKANPAKSQFRMSEYDKSFSLRSSPRVYAESERGYSLGADADLTQMLSHMHAIDQAEDESPVPLSAPVGAAPPPRPARPAATLLGLGVSWRPIDGAFEKRETDALPPTVARSSWRASRCLSSDYSRPFDGLRPPIRRVHLPTSFSLCSSYLLDSDRHVRESLNSKSIAVTDNNTDRFDNIGNQSRQSQQLYVSVTPFRHLCRADEQSFSPAAAINEWVLHSSTLVATLCSFPCTV